MVNARESYPLYVSPLIVAVAVVSLLLTMLVIKLNVLSPVALATIASDYDQVRPIPNLKYKAVCDKSTLSHASCDAQVVINSKGVVQADSSTPPASAYGPARFHTAYQLPCTTGGPVASICSQPSSFETYDCNC